MTRKGREKEYFVSRLFAYFAGRLAFYRNGEYSAARGGGSTGEALRPGFAYRQACVIIYVNTGFRLSCPITFFNGMN